MHVSELMTRDIETIRPDATIAAAAKTMDDLNVGALPVCDGKRLVGMITDRDITVRATSVGKGPETCKVKDAMTAEAVFCMPDDSVETAAERMAARQIRRLPVVSRDDHQLIGILSLGDIATEANGDITAGTLKEISEPSRPDRTGQG